jgi:hypothetical protein
VDFDDQHVLVIGAVEDADAAALGQRFHVSPEEIVIEFLGGGFFETEDLAALRVHAGHDVADGAVLAGGVHRLEDDEHRVGVRGVEQFLGLGELLAAFLEDFRGALLDEILAEFLASSVSVQSVT